LTTALGDKEIVRRWMQEVWTTDDFSFLQTIVHPDLIDHMPVSGHVPGRDGHLEKMKRIKAAFTDIDIRVDALIQEGDRVVGLWTFTATHSGLPFLGQPARNSRVKFCGMDMVRVEDGKIREIWHIEDLFKAYGQISGTIPV
jgi:predicted ester cyclase